VPHPNYIQANVIVEGSVPPRPVRQLYNELLDTCSVGLKEIRILPAEKIVGTMTELQTTCSDFLNLFERFESLGLTLSNVKEGCLEFILEFHSKEDLVRLWLMCESGELLAILEDNLITSDLLKRCDVESIQLRVQISEEVYHKCLVNFGEL